MAPNGDVCLAACIVLSTKGMDLVDGCETRRGTWATYAAGRPPPPSPSAASTGAATEAARSTLLDSTALRARSAGAPRRTRDVTTGCAREVPRVRRRGSGEDANAPKAGVGAAPVLALTHTGARAAAGAARAARVAPRAGARSGVAGRMQVCMILVFVVQLNVTVACTATQFPSPARQRESRLRRDYVAKAVDRRIEWWLRRTVGAEGAYSVCCGRTACTGIPLYPV